MGGWGEVGEDGEWRWVGGGGRTSGEGSAGGLGGGKMEALVMGMGPCHACGLVRNA